MTSSALADVDINSKSDKHDGRMKRGQHFRIFSFTARVTGWELIRRHINQAFATLFPVSFAASRFAWKTGRGWEKGGWSRDNISYEA